MYPLWLRQSLSQLTVTNLGFYATLSMLTIYMVNHLHFTSEHIAVTLLCSTLGLRVSRFALAPFLNRLPPRRLLVYAITASATGYLFLAFSSELLPVSLSLLLVGIGYGCNGLAVTTLSSFALPDQRRHVYALQYTLGHTASAIAPLAAGLLVDHFIPQSVFILSAMLVCISGVFIRALECEAWQTEPQGFYQRARALLESSQLRCLFASTAMGWCVYTQKYATLPLLILSSGGDATRLGKALLAYSLTIVAVSLPVSHLLKRHAIAEPHAIATAFIVYSAGFMLVAFQPAWLYPAIFLWGVAEALIMPSLNNAVGHITDTRGRLVAFSLMALFVGLGEWVGMAGGVALFRHLTAENIAECYTLLAISSIVFLAIHLFIFRSRKLAYAS